jgi:hypothetical protein
MTINKALSAIAKPSKRLSVLHLGGLACLVIASFEVISTPPVSAQSANLSNISADTFSCMRRHNRGVGGWVTYDGDNQGRILVFATGLGQVGELTFTFDANQQTLSIAHVQGRAPFGQVQSGLNDTANKCRSGEYR